MQRKNPQTSIDAYNRIMASGTKETTYKKILSALLIIGEGNYEAIANQANETESRVWKRLIDCKRMDLIFDTGKRILTKSGSNSMVYALSSRRSEYANVVKSERIGEEIVPSDFASLLVAGTKQQKAIQNSLFNEER